MFLESFTYRQPCWNVAHSYVFNDIVTILFLESLKNCHANVRIYANLKKRNGVLKVRLAFDLVSQ